LTEAASRIAENYTPWDELRRKSFPAGIRARDVWAFVTLMRDSSLRPLPILRDIKGHRFSYQLTDRATETLFEIEAIARDRFGLLSNMVTPDTEREVVINALMEESIHSSLLEGAATTRKAAKEMLRKGRRPVSLGERMIVNNFRTMSLLEERLDRELTPDLVREIHASMTTGTIDVADEGRLQVPGEERVVVMDIDGSILHSPPSAAELEGRLESLCRFANSTTPFLPPVARGIFLHFQLAHDHPFVDGNGRTARALFYWLMLKQDYRLFRFLTISRVFLKKRAQYSRAFIHTEQTGDLTYFLLFHLKVVSESLDGLGRYLEKRRSEYRAAQSALADNEQLNMRQRQLLGSALGDLSRDHTARSVMGIFGVSRATALSDLRGLVDAGFFQVHQIGRRKHFTPTPRLEKKIRSS